MLLQDEIEHSFGAGPAHRPVEELVAAGHGRLRRRRAAGGAAALATIAALGLTYAVGQTGVPRGEDTPVASDPSNPAEDQDLVDGQPAMLGRDGLILADGARVVREVENPLGVEPPGTSVGLVVEYQGQTIWTLLDRYGNGAGAVYDEAGRTFSTFDLWLDDAVAVQLGEPTLALVAFRPDGSLRAAEPGVEVLDQQQEPAMPRSFAGPDEETAVAQVTWRGEPWFVLARRLPGYDPEYFPTEASIVGQPATIEDFLVVARDRYANDDGLR
jgi:hypothetical protein